MNCELVVLCESLKLANLRGLISFVPQAKTSLAVWSLLDDNGIIETSLKMLESEATANERVRIVSRLSSMTVHQLATINYTALFKELVPDETPEKVAHTLHVGIRNVQYDAERYFA